MITPISNPSGWPLAVEDKRMDSKTSQGERCDTNRRRGLQRCLQTIRQLSINTLIWRKLSFNQFAYQGIRYGSNSFWLDHF